MNAKEEPLEHIGDREVPSSAEKQVLPPAEKGAIVSKEIETKLPVEQPRLARRCPTCGCKRWRHIGSVNTLGDDGKRTECMRIIECMRCDEAWDDLDPQFQPNERTN